MTEEGMGSVPRSDRPSIEDLEGITESRYPPDTDYSSYRTELAIWLNDYRREQEEKRESEQQGNRQALLGHGTLKGDSRQGFERFDVESEDGFDLTTVAETFRKRPTR